LSRLSIWNSGKKSSDYRFIDRSISEFFGIGGTAALIHLYIGPYLQPTTETDLSGGTTAAYDPNNPSVTTGGIMTVEDAILGETRDRAYSPVTIELRCIYNLNDLDFDLRQFGLFLTNDDLYIEFHFNDMMARCGRKIIPGDVIELPHRRDTGLDPSNQIAANKFYVVTDAARAADGYSATWYPHIWRTHVTPMPASQEYNDILNAPALDPLGLPVGGVGPGAVPTPTIGTVLGTDGDANTALNDAIDAQAKIDVPARYFETQHFYMTVPERGSDSDPWVFAGDGIPPNGAVLIGSGSQFPPQPSLQDYYLRTDYKPATLFMWTGTVWKIQEQNYRPNWMAANSLLLDFINNDNVSTFEDGTQAPEKTNLSRAVSPKADF
jgi:hypothetical protein